MIENGTIILVPYVASWLKLAERLHEQKYKLAPGERIKSFPFYVNLKNGYIYILSSCKEKYDYIDCYINQRRHSKRIVVHCLTLSIAQYIHSIFKKYGSSNSLTIKRYYDRMGKDMCVSYSMETKDMKYGSLDTYLDDPNDYILYEYSNDIEERLVEDGFLWKE